MHDYWLTFRITGDGAAARRAALIAGLRAEAENDSWWDETEPFVMFRSRLTLAELRKIAEQIVDRHDFVLIGMVHVLKWEIIGQAQNDALYRSLRYAHAFG